MVASAQKPTDSAIWSMFNRIAHRYDLLNLLLSFRQDQKWRKAIGKLLPKKNALKILDLATGTGDVPITLVQAGYPIENVLGVDMASDMLAVGQKKVKKMGLAQKIRFKKGNAMQLDLEGEFFDVATMAFGIRNTSRPDLVLGEIFTHLIPGGKALILEFSTPGNWFFRQIYLLYFRYVLPKIGGYLSGDPSAYHYLNQSAENFAQGAEFLDLMRSAGFVKLEAVPQTFGIANIYVGEKPSDMAQ